MRICFGNKHIYLSQCRADSDSQNDKADETNAPIVRVYNETARSHSEHTEQNGRKKTEAFDREIIDKISGQRADKLSDKQLPALIVVQRKLFGKHGQNLTDQNGCDAR